MIYKNEYFTLPSRRRYLFSPALAFPLPSSHTFSPLYFSPDPYPRRIPDSGFFAFLHTARNISVVFPVLFFFHSRFRSDDKPGTSERIEHPGTGDAQFNYSARSDGGGGGGKKRRKKTSLLAAENRQKPCAKFLFPRTSGGFRIWFWVEARKHNTIYFVNVHRIVSTVAALRGDEEDLLHNVVRPHFLPSHNFSAIKINKL